MSPRPSIVRVQRALRAPAGAVFAAWMTPALLERWMFARAGDEVVKLAVDPRVGGRFSFRIRRDGQEIDHVGAYLELEVPRRIAFTWSVGQARADDSRVQLDMEEVPGGVLLTLVHSLPPDAADYADRTRAGWMRMLGALALLLDGEGEPAAPGP